MTANGAVNAIGAIDRRIGYAELIGGNRFDVKMSGKVKPKDASQYRLVGKPVPRKDIELKVTARYDYMVDFKLPGMLHARVIRPPEAGAKFSGFDTKQKLAGLLNVVTPRTTLAWQVRSTARHSEGDPRAVVGRSFQRLLGINPEAPTDRASLRGIRPTREFLPTQRSSFLMTLKLKCLIGDGIRARGQRPA